jgi:hypothetical protein
LSYLVVIILSLWYEIKNPSKVEEREAKGRFSYLEGITMKRIFNILMSMMALVCVITIANAQTVRQSNLEERAASQNLGYNSAYQSGTIVGIISGPYGSVLFVKLEDNTKLRFHHPGTSIDRGDRILVFKKNGEYFLLESATPE